MKKHVSVAALCLAFGFACTAAVAAVPFFNATCPNDISVHADEGGPVFIDGREAKIRPSNENYFEARDAESGVTLSITRSPSGEVQVSYAGRKGANGVCSVVAPDRPDAAPDQSGAASSAADSTTSVPTTSDSPAKEVTCESQDHRQTECEMDTRGDVRMVRQLSTTRCEQGENWGLNRHSVWVKDGCRAVFSNVSGSRKK